ncbi:MAG: peptidoglycan recognition family protein [Ilumatobacteraceae bacterium]
MCTDDPSVTDCDHPPAGWTRRSLLAAAAGTLVAGRSLTGSGRAVALPGKGGFGDAGRRSGRGAPGPARHPAPRRMGPRPSPRAEHASEDVRFLLVHHTASANTYPSGGARSVIRSTYAFQTGPAKGWPDVCYHFFVDHDGVIWEGRAGSLAGPVVADATGGNQGFAQLVCLIGDFTSTVPTAAALDSLTGVLAWLADRYSVPTEPGVLVPFVAAPSDGPPERP